MKKNLFFKKSIVAVLLLAFLMASCNPTEIAVEETEQGPSEVQATKIIAEDTATTVNEDLGCPKLTALDMQGFTTEWPLQFESDEFAEKTNCSLVLSQNPVFENRSLPVVEERVPVDFVVITPFEELGKYGGQMKSVSFSPESGTAEMLSWRHVNLVRLDYDKETIKPDIAKSWEWNADRTEITFHLREGHKWSDGEPFTADDILFWFKDIKLNEELSGTYPSWLIFGGGPMEVAKIDDLTVKFKFENTPYAFLPWLSTTYVQVFQPKHFLSQFHIEYNENANDLAVAEGFEDWTGLFRSYYHDWKDSYHRVGVPTLEAMVMTEEDTEHRLYEANPYYHKVDTAGNQLPYITTLYETYVSDREVINLKILNGEIDIKGQGLALYDFPTLKENETAGDYNVTLSSSGLSNGMFYVFNVTHPDLRYRAIYSDVKFKQAMALAINREELNEIVYLGLGEPIAGVSADPYTCSFVTEDQKNYFTEYDPERAKAILDSLGMKIDATGWRTFPDGKPFIIYFEYAEQAGPVKVQELVVSYWKAIGIQVEMKELSTEAWRARTLANQHDVFVWRNDNNASLKLIAEQIRFYPPFAYGVVEQTGGPWADYWETNGADGEEPPEWANQLREMAIEFGSTEPFTTRWNELGNSMVQIYIDQMVGIGTLGNLPAPVIVSNKLGNVPDWPIQIWDYYWQMTFGVDQFFFY